MSFRIRRRLAASQLLEFLFGATYAVGVDASGCLLWIRSSETVWKRSRIFSRLRRRSLRLRAERILEPHDERGHDGTAEQLESLTQDRAR